MTQSSRSRWLNYIRLAGFPLGLGLTSALVGGTLNRVMIVELEIPAAFVGFLFALPLLISPVRVWLGFFSDTHPMRGLRREPYIVIGALLSALAVITLTSTVLKVHPLTTAVMVLIMLAFVVYGMGKNLASNTFEALLADVFHDDQRPRAVTLYKVAMFAGIIGGALTLGRLLEPYTPAKLATIVYIVMTLALTLAIFGVLRQEPPLPVNRRKPRHSVSFGETVRSLVLPDPQVRLFFIIVVLTVIGTLTQDVLLEPYGALALNMTVGQTSRLTAIWGSGTVFAMAATGIWLVKRFGYRPVMAVGLAAGALVFIGLIIAGLIQNQLLFMVLVFFLGISTGLSSAAMLSTVIAFTSAEHAGLLMGVWGLAHELGQASGNLLGGTVVDIVRALTNGNAMASYGTVFVLEASILVATLILMRKLDLKQSVILRDENQVVPSFSAISSD